MIAIFGRKNHKSDVYILIVHYTNDEIGDNIIRALGKVKYTIKSKTLRKDECELTIQVTYKSDNMIFTEKIRSLEFVTDLTLVQYNGEYHG